MTRDGECSLREALAGGQLEVHYQPTVALPSGMLVGTEALVRWQHPTRGLVGPDEFISIAEETGLIVPLGTWVLHQAAQQTKSWQQLPGCADLTVAVNLSVAQLRQPDLVDAVTEVLQESGLSPSSLELEITESVFTVEQAHAAEVIDSLKSLGVRVSLDDFGTGYSSLSRLKRFNVDALKIDRSFVDGLGRDVGDSAIVDAIVSMSRALGLETVAEGVETPLQLRELNKLGCEYAQGYLFAGPAPAAALGDILSGRRSLAPPDVEPGAAHRGDPPVRSPRHGRDGGLGTRRGTDAPVVPIVGRMSRLKIALIAGAVGAMYAALSQYVLWLNDPVHAGAGFWPAAGLTLAALLLAPRRAWLPILVAVATAEIVGDLARGYPFGAATFWAAGNVIEPLVGAALIRRVRPQAWRLAPLDNLLAFLVLGAIVGPVVGASVGSLGSVLWFDNPVWTVWPKYVVGDALGVLVVAPLLLHVSQLRLPRCRIGEATCFWVTLAAFGALAFHDWRAEWSVALPYFLVPMLVWAALRSGVAATAAAAFVVAQAANLATARGSGPFAFVGDPTGHALTFLQIYVGIAVGTALILAAVVSDLVSRREVELQLTHQATHDDLTGLPNRAFVYQLLDRSFDRAQDDGSSVGVLFCDLDGFKEINDTLGHEWGDQVLVVTAQRLLAASRAGDVVGRVGGDEFVIVCPDLASVQMADSLANRLKMAVRAPIVHEGRSVQVTASIGLASTDGSATVDEILCEADTAMYVAKRRLDRRAAAWQVPRDIGISRVSTPDRLSSQP